MTCRHSPGDTDCSKHKDYEYYHPSATPVAPSVSLSSVDSYGFEILDVEEIGVYLVLKVKYESCRSCAYEGVKVLIVQAKMKEALLWRKLDPHFRDSKFSKKECPSPIARFPASVEGWNAAIEYAKWKIIRTKGGS